MALVKSYSLDLKREIPLDLPLQAIAEASAAPYRLGPISVVRVQDLSCLPRGLVTFYVSSLDDSADGQARIDKVALSVQTEILAELDRRGAQADAGIRMSDAHDVPSTPLGVLEAFQNLCVSIATGGARDDVRYKLLRREALRIEPVQAALPTFARTCSDAQQFWSFIKQTAEYDARRKRIWADFRPALSALDSGAPSDATITSALDTVDGRAVQAMWDRALARRTTDPEAAITAARSLLESTCKFILHSQGVAFDDAAELPKLYRETAKALKLAPDQHTEQIFKQILGGCQSVVEGLGALRNRLGDAHGKGPLAVRPASRHAALAVNLAGATALFLVETWEARTATQ